MISQDRHRGCVETDFRGKQHLWASPGCRASGWCWLRVGVLPRDVSRLGGHTCFGSSAPVLRRGCVASWGTRSYWAFARHVPGGGVSLFHVRGLFGGRDVVVKEWWKVPLVDVGTHHAIDHFHRDQSVGRLDEFAEEVLAIIPHSE